MKKALSLGRWVVGAAIGLSIGTIFFVTYEQHRAAEKYKTHREEYCAALMVSAEEKKACAEEGTSARDYLPWGYDLVAWPDGVTTWAIIFTGFAIAWQSWETRKSARASRDAIILQHRPKIVVRELSLKRQESGGFDIKLILRNSGSTVASIGGWKFRIWWMKEGHPTEDHTESIDATMLKPGETRSYDFTAPEFYVRFEASRIMLEENPAQEQGVFLACVGVMTYKDEIGTRRDTAISRVYMFRQRSFEVPRDGQEADYSD